jgi:hypothetical protein
MEGFLHVAPTPHAEHCPRPIHRPLSTDVSECELARVMLLTIFFKVQLIKLIFLREIHIIVGNKFFLLLLAF